MISQRQIDFREEYRSRIIGWYDGYFHIVLIYAMGAAAFYVYVEHIHNVTWLEWLTVPLTFLFTNLFEWAVHKFVMCAIANRSTIMCREKWRLVDCRSNVVKLGSFFQKYLSL